MKLLVLFAAFVAGVASSTEVPDVEDQTEHLTLPVDPDFHTLPPLPVDPLEPDYLTLPPHPEESTDDYVIDYFTDEPEWVTPEEGMFSEEPNWFTTEMPEIEEPEESFEPACVAIPILKVIKTEVLTEARLIKTAPAKVVKGVILRRLKAFSMALRSFQNMVENHLEAHPPLMEDDMIHPHPDFKAMIEKRDVPMLLNEIHFLIRHPHILVKVLQFHADEVKHLFYETLHADAEHVRDTVAGMMTYGAHEFFEIAFNEIVSEFGCDEMRPRPFPTGRPRPFPTGRPRPFPTGRPRPFPTGRPRPFPTGRPRPFPTGRPRPFPTGRPRPFPTGRPRPFPTGRPRPFPTGRPRPFPTGRPRPSKGPKPTWKPRPSKGPRPSRGPKPTTQAPQPMSTDVGPTHPPH